MQVEAAAFAWLAKQCANRVPLQLQKITGARGSRVLGAVYPA
jgi:anhydro-N-acetylmuramic acid kinase